MLVCKDDLKNMHLTNFQSMVLFSTSISLPSHSSADDSTSVSSSSTSYPGGSIVVTHNSPKGAPNGGLVSIDVPLEPDIDDLKTMKIVMHRSGTQAYDMGSHYNEWFSTCFGFDVILAYIGENRREVLGNLPPQVALQERASRQSWLDTLTSNIPSWKRNHLEWQDSGLSFSDCAPFLIVSEKSMENVNGRLPENDRIDIVKFRPNIVVGGADRDFDEDFWAELNIGEDKDVILTANCGRCVSVNIDYETGEAGKGESGTVLKKLMRDRRVDTGNKWSPIFGRYGFIGKSKGNNPRIEIGESVVVKKRNEERTKFGE